MPVIYQPQRLNNDLPACHVLGCAAAGSDPHVLAANDARFQQTKRRGKKKVGGEGARARRASGRRGGGGGSAGLNNPATIHGMFPPCQCRLLESRDTVVVGVTYIDIHTL
eukprot:COSAG01_NODE_18119_length_1099_cov_2.228000_1_plen_110_part_00